MGLMGLLSAGCASRSSMTPEEQLWLLQNTTPEQRLQYQQLQQQRETNQRVRMLEQQMRQQTEQQYWQRQYEQLMDAQRRELERLNNPDNYRPIYVPPIRW
jgi:hypothetical protein